MRALIPLTLLLSACDPATSTGVCEADDPIVPVASCLVPLDDPALLESWRAVGEAEVELPSAVIDALGEGSPDGDSASFEGWSDCGLDGDAVWWARVVDPEGGRWLVGASAGGATPGWEDGQQIALRWSWEEDSPYAGHYGLNELTVEDYEGALIAWVAHGWSLAGLDVPDGLSLARGEEISREEGECYTEVRYALDVSREGDEATLCFGESASLTGYTVVYGGATEAEDLQCSETSGDVIHVAVLR